MLNFIFARDLLSAFGLGQKKIHQILNKEIPDDTQKLEELLSEEETIGECKQQNAKLLEFLCRPDNLSKLIKFATRDPTDPNNKDAAHKYPFVATDILVSCMKIADALVKVKENEVLIEEEKKEEEVQSDRQRVDTEEEQQIETQAVQEMLKKVNEESKQNNEGEITQKEQLVEDLNEIDLENEEDHFSNLLQANGGESGEETETKAVPTQRKSFTDKIQEENPQNDEEDTNVKDDNEPESEHQNNNNIARQKFNIQISTAANKKEEVPPTPEYDFSLLDELFAFLDQGEGVELQPILCGYFNKIVTALLGKIKPKILTYLLIQKEGILFDKLLNHLEHHSLAQLLIELLQLRIVSATSSTRDRFSSDFDKEETKTDEGGEHSEDERQKEFDKMTPSEKQQYEVLDQKKQQVVQTLINRVSSRNKDIEQCLNAHTILMELADHDQTFGKLVQKDNLAQLIRAACDVKNPNQSYALNILITIIKEFPNYDRQIGQTLAAEFQHVIGTNFLDLTYSCVMVIRSPDLSLGNQTSESINQAGVKQRNFGFKRLKALELIRQELQTLTKYPDLDTDLLISNILRRQIINAMLYIIEEFKFCSIACQQAILVLDFFKNIFDDEELDLLKSFISRNLLDNPNLVFESGLQTTATNLFTIVKMGMVLKNMTLGNANASSSYVTLEDEDKDHESNKDLQQQHHQQSRDLKHLNDPEWRSFCEGPLQYYETKWTKKLEDYIKEREGNNNQQNHSDGEGGYDEINLDKDDDDEEEEQKQQEGSKQQTSEKERKQIEDELQAQLQQMSPRTRAHKQRNLSVDLSKTQKLEANSKDSKKHKDDWGVNKLIDDDYLDNLYWKVPEQYNIDQLLIEQAQEEEQQK